ncbi:DUF6114 domain-containing protein [Gordonia jinhuaensis]|nr:DUF6114 domain-containing protein [Gordonia jinhuaensis]
MPSTDGEHPERGESPTRRERFARWRATRPFTGAMFLIASALFLGLPALTTVRLGDVLITITSISGVSTVLFSVLMAICAVSVLVVPGARIPAGLFALVLAVITLPAANFGGFLLGTVTGIVGAAATLAWRPVDQSPQR